MLKRINPKSGSFSKPIQYKILGLIFRNNLFASSPLYSFEVKTMARRGGYGVILLLIVMISMFFLYPSLHEFPMDDTYIHFVYAQNLAEKGEFIFNYPGESGVGVTSLLWVILLSGGYALGFSLHMVAKILGVFSLVVVGMILYYLLSKVWNAKYAFLGALSVVLSGHLVWFALSGMETVMFLALGLLALVLYQKRQWGWLGLILGLQTLTRPEGGLLLLIIGIVETWRIKGVNRNLVYMVAVYFVVVSPWFIYLQMRTGSFLPTSAYGKQLSMFSGIRNVMGRNQWLAFLGEFPSLLYPFIWVAYVLEFVLGGIALPPPNLSAGTVLNNEYYTYSVWALFGLIGVVFPLIWVVFQRLSVRYLFSRLNDRRYLVFIIFGFWVVIHNISYLIFLPFPGTASRYGIINHVILWLLLVFGLKLFIENRYRFWAILAGGLFIMFFANTIYWNNVYDANLDHMNRVRIQAAQFIRNRLNSDDFCAAFDVGALRFHTQRPVLDLGGLVDSDLQRKFKNGAIDSYLIEKGVRCLILPGRMGNNGDGWFDFAKAFGFTSTSLFNLQVMRVFEIDQERWLEGYLATNNYQATVTIYRLIERRGMGN